MIVQWFSGHLENIFGDRFRWRQYVANIHQDKNVPGMSVFNNQTLQS